MPSSSMQMISKDKVILQDEHGGRSKIIKAVVADNEVHIGSDTKLPVVIGNKIVHLRADDTEVEYIIENYDVHDMVGELYYVIKTRRDTSPKPKWLTKQAPDKVQMRVPEIVGTIRNWIPKQRFRGEEAYEAALAEHLVGQGIEAPEQQGMSLTDILAANGIGIEVKLKPDRSEYDRLSGQIIRQLEEFGVVVVLVLRPDKRDLLEEYRSQFENDSRVTFIVK